MDLLALLSDFTLRTVALGAALLGGLAGALGCFAVLRRQSLIGDTLSHAALPGVCIGFLLSGTRAIGPIMLGALATGALAALTVLALTRATRLKTDAALGIALSVFFAAGVVLLSHIQGRGGAGQAGLESFLFGQAAALLPADLQVMAGIAAATSLVLLALWKEFKLVAFDPVFAHSLGLPVLALETLLTVLVAVAVVVGLQMVGVVLMAAMVIAPAVAARQWVSRLGPMVGLAAVFGAGSGVAGALASAAGRGLATGPLIVLAASLLVLVSILLAPRRGLLRGWLNRLRERRALRGRQVLGTMLGLARAHDDPHYPSEQAMLDLYHGGRTDRAMARLAARGHVLRVDHMPGEGAHWVLTAAGTAEAERIARDAGAGPGARDAAPDSAPADAPDARVPR